MLENPIKGQKKESPQYSEDKVILKDLCELCNG